MSMTQSARRHGLFSAIWWHLQGLAQLATEIVRLLRTTSQIALLVRPWFHIVSLCLRVNLELTAQLHKLDFTTSASMPIYLSDASNFFANSLAKLRLHDSKLQSRIVVDNVPQTICTTSRLIRLSISPNSKESLISPASSRKSLTYSLEQLQRLWQLIV